MSLIINFLQIKFYTKDSVIERVTLSNSKKSVLEWEIISPAKNRALELAIEKWLEEFQFGKEPSCPLPLALEKLPPFTQKVLKELLNIPFGKTKTYGEIAALLNHPKAARAVGNACGRNPFPLIIPCHRVLPSNGKLGGYAFGTEVKRLLLDFEASF